jgi:hypothetical protein
MTGRYEIRVIGNDTYTATALGTLLHTCDDAADAKAMANDLAGTEFYGVAVLDTVTGTVDWGDEITPVTGVVIE